MNRRWVFLGIVSAMALILSGCLSLPLKLSDDCPVLREQSRWVELIQQSESKHGAPGFLILALLEPPLNDFDKKHVRPRVSDWDEYRIRNEHWDASPYEPEDAVNFIDWFASETVKRNQLSWEAGADHYLALRLGHGGLARFDPKRFPELHQQAQQVQVHMNAYRRAWASCNY